MDGGRFLAILDKMGDFRCNLDRRRLNNRRPPHHRQQSDAAWQLWFGHCRNGRHHSCEFILNEQPPGVIYYYMKNAVRDGIIVRVKGTRPMNMKGRGRRPKRGARPQNPAK